MTALVFFALDTVGYLLYSVVYGGFGFKSLIDVLFHAWVLYYLINGLVANAKLKRLGEEAELTDETDINEYKNKVVEKGLFTLKDMDEYKSIPQLTDFLYKKLLRANIVGPVVMYNYPASLKPLARRNDDDAKAVDCFQVVVMGAEICNAYSELVDPAIQRETFEDQLAQKEAGDDETMDLDEDYLLAMEQGMPPISGLGFGIDRLMMIAYNLETLRDAILFPTMKPIERN